LDFAARRAAVLEVLDRDREPQLPRPHEGVARWVSLLKTCTPRERAGVLASLERIRSPDPSSYRPMERGALVQLAERGHEIGSHGVTHAPLATLGDDELHAELERSRRALTQWVGRSPLGLAYPNGSHDARVVDAAAGAGYSYAVTTLDGVHRRGDDPFRIRRIDIVGDRIARGAQPFDATAFRRELCGLYRRRGRAPVAR
jgi:peptidoglycan/xylan/chitin deacetylase (PgdA/CDA1 family)